MIKMYAVLKMSHLYLSVYAYMISFQSAQSFRYRNGILLAWVWEFHHSSRRNRSRVFKKSSTFKIFKGPVCKQSAKKLHGLFVDRLTLSSTLVLASEEISPVHELYVRECKTVLDSAFHAVKFRIPGTGSQSLSVELGLRIAIVCGVPDSKAQDFGFHKQFFLKILDSTSKNFGFPYMRRLTPPTIPQ